jgi:hypothetical protein
MPYTDQEVCYSGNTLYLHFGGAQFKALLRSNCPDSVNVFPQSVQENAGIVPLFGHDLLVCTTLMVSDLTSPPPLKQYPNCVCEEQQSASSWHQPHHHMLEANFGNGS